MKSSALQFISFLVAFVSIAAEADAQNLNRTFGNTAGAFVLYDLRNDRYVRHNEERCRRRFTPASTFKIPNSLIGLETGVVRDADFLISWNRQRYPDQGRPHISPFIHWWKDHTLRSAMRHSVLWYYCAFHQPKDEWSSSFTSLNLRSKDDEHT